MKFGIILIVRKWWGKNVFSKQLAKPLFIVPMIFIIVLYLAVQPSPKKNIQRVLFFTQNNSTVQNKNSRTRLKITKNIVPAYNCIFFNSINCQGEFNNYSMLTD
jgi:hypothetical protein